MTEILALALKLKEVNKKTSNIDEKVETLAINQKTTINDKMVAIFDEFKAEYQDFIKNIPLPTNGKDFDIKLWEKIENDINSLINSKISELDKQKADYIKQTEYCFYNSRQQAIGQKPKQHHQTQSAPEISFNNV